MKKVLLVLFFTCVIVGVCVLLGLFSLVPDLQSPSYAKQELIFANYKDTLYIKKRTIGNEAIVVISIASGSEFDPDTSSEFVYDVSSTPFLYKETADSLIVYTRELSEVPYGFKSKIKILQIKLNNPQMMDLVSKNHFRDIGIRKFD